MVRQALCSHAITSGTCPAAKGEHTEVCSANSRPVKLSPAYRCVGTWDSDPATWEAALPYREAGGDSALCLPDKDRGLAPSSLCTCSTVI